jgi:uncharacterized protein (TIGR02246 family)
MRTLRICLLGSFVALTGPAVAQTAGHEQAIKTAQTVAAAYATAFDQHDAKTISMVFVPDGVFLPPNGAPMVQGRDAIERTWADLFKTVGGDETITVRDAMPVGTDAIIAINEFKIIGDDSNKIISGRALITLAKTPDGWRYAAIAPQVQPTK